VAPRPFLCRNRFNPEGIAIPGEEEAFIGKAKRARFAGAGKGHGGPTGRACAGGKPERGGAEKPRAARHPYPVSGRLTHAFPLKCCYPLGGLALKKK
jgi:hypothetical protein